MPELPEVHTTATELDRLLAQLIITDVWSDYRSVFHKGKPNIKDANYLKKFKKEIVGKKVLRVRRRAKNILIDLSGNTTILIHMKMTGHLLYGKYRTANAPSSLRKREFYQTPNGWETETWIPDEQAQSPLFDPFNRFIHLAFSFSNGKNLVLSDVRKFAKVIYFPTDTESTLVDLCHLGPEPFTLSFALFCERLLSRPKTPIKQVLMDQRVIAGIGNIYSDELLWLAGVHPLSSPSLIPKPYLKKIFESMRTVLEKGIDFSGDSTSDYRTPSGERGAFHHHHNVYRETKTACRKRGCPGIIVRKMIAGRSAHFCPDHQQRF